jgi:hypothetical protein
MSIFVPKWNETFAPKLYLYERGGRVIGAVTRAEQIQSIAVVTTKFVYHSLLAKTDGTEEKTHSTLEEARSEVETLLDRDSK